MDANLSIEVASVLARLVALWMVITVIGIAQCINVCAVRPCDDQAAAKSSCHHSPSKQSKSNCVHQEVLRAENAVEIPTAPDNAILSVRLNVTGEQETRQFPASASTTVSPPTLRSAIILRI